MAQLLRPSLVVAVLALCVPMPAQEEREARLPVKVVAGRLVVRCDISTKVRRVPANLIVDFARPSGFELHNRAADHMKVDAEGGLPVTLHFSGFDIQQKGREHGDEEAWEAFTRLHSKDLGEIACLGALGSKVFAPYKVIFDIQAGFIYLRPPAERSEEVPAEAEGEIIVATTLVNDLVWMPVRLKDGRTMQLAVGTSREDTVIDEDICRAMGRPAGDIGPVLLRNLDLHGFVALRPEPLVQVHPEGALGVCGLNLLKGLRIEIDRINRWVRVRQTAPAVFPEEDLAYFRARLEEEPEPLVAWLEKYPAKRLARECSERLLDLQLDRDAEVKEFEVALDWIDRTRIEDLRTTEGLGIMKLLEENRRPDVAIMAGRLATKSGRTDRYPESIHKVHARLGELLLDDPESRREAWEHLLSAAFGLPEDGMINYQLGRFYEMEGRYDRAMSRYIQAVTQAESGALAIPGLERVQEKLGNERLSVDLVDRMVAGKVYNFGAATTFEPTAENTTNRVVLVELFTNPHFGRRLTEGWRSFAIGGAMAMEGLLSHFPRSHVAALVYHVEAPEPHALVTDLGSNMADYYGDARPIYTMVNGIAKGPGAEVWRKAEELYEANRGLVNRALLEPSDHTLSLVAKVEDGVVSGTVEVKGKEASGVLLQIVLAERGVLYPGKAQIVVHRMVARAPLTDSVDGIPVRMKDGTMRHDFRAELAKIEEEHVAYLKDYETQSGKACSRVSTRIDPRQVTIVAYLRDSWTKEVLQAVQINPAGAEPAEAGR